MAFNGPYPTKFSGTSVMVINATTFSGGVTNAGTIGPGGVTINSSTFLTGGFLNSNLISGGTGIGVFAGSTVHGAIVDSGRIVATDRGIDLFGGIVFGGIRSPITARFQLASLASRSTPLRSAAASSTAARSRPGLPAYWPALTPFPAASAIIVRLSRLAVTVF